MRQRSGTADGGGSAVASTSGRRPSPLALALALALALSLSQFFSAAVDGGTPGRRRSSAGAVVSGCRQSMTTSADRAHGPAIAPHDSNASAPARTASGPLAPAIDR